MLEWFLPLHKPLIFQWGSGEAVTLLHYIQLLFACCWAQVWALSSWIARKTEIRASQVQTGTAPCAALFVSPVLEDWRQCHGIDWEVDQVKTELIWDSEFNFGFSWVNACIKCPGVSLKCPIENYLCHNDSSTQQWCRQDTWSQVFSWGEEKGLTGGSGCFPRGISDQFRRRGEICNLVFCWEGVLASKLFFFLMSRYQSRF